MIRAIEKCPAASVSTRFGALLVPGVSGARLIIALFSGSPVARLVTVPAIVQSCLSRSVEAVAPLVSVGVGVSCAKACEPQARTHKLRIAKKGTVAFERFRMLADWL